MNFDIAPSGGGKPHHLYPPADPSAHPTTAATTPQTTAAAAHAPGANPTPADTTTAAAAPTASAAPTATTAPAPTASTPDSRSTTFQAVEGGSETRSGETLMVEAYTVLWILLMGWLVFLWRKQATLNTRLDDLEHAIDRAAATTGTKAPAASEKRAQKSAGDESPSNV